MKKAIPISKMPTEIIIAEILTYERDEKDLTFEEVFMRGDELDAMPRKEIEALYLAILLS